MQNKFRSHKNISEMKNLGPAVEMAFHAVGIFTASAVIKLGPEKAFKKMLDGRRKLGHSVKCCNALYLYALYGAIHNKDWRKLSKSRKDQIKAYTDRLRKSGKYGR